jgi:hypothetical protein
MSTLILESLLLISKTPNAWSCTHQGECHRSMMSLSLALNCKKKKLSRTDGNSINLDVKDDVMGFISKLSVNIENHKNSHILYQITIRKHTFIIEVYNEQARILSLWGSEYGFLDYMNKDLLYNKFQPLYSIMVFIRLLWQDMENMTSVHFDAPKTFIEYNKYMTIVGPILIVDDVK